MRVLLVDTCPATRRGVSVSLREAAAEDVEVLREATNAEEAALLSDEMCPDLVILDIELQDEREGLRLCKMLKSSSKNRPQVLVYTARNSREDVAAASLVGADGFLHKSADCAKICETVNMMRGRDRVWLLGPATAERQNELGTLIEEADLTPKEKEVFSLLLRRHTNAEIANELALSYNTVKTHVSSILRKLALSSRKELWEMVSSSKEGKPSPN